MRRNGEGLNVRLQERVILLNHVCHNEHLLKLCFGTNFQWSCTDRMIIKYHFFHYFHFPTT
jgi:hypothetical protein